MSKQITLEGVPQETLWMKFENGKIVDNKPCGPTPPGEIVVRSAYCNLRCIPCFAYSYSWPEEAYKNKDVAKVPMQKIASEIRSFLEHNKPKGKDYYNWFRILGGEPFLNEAYLKSYIDIISKIDAEHYRLFNNSVLVQTNGVVLGRLSKESLLRNFEPVADKHLKIVVEISIKGSNPKEFEIITQSKAESSRASYYQHIKACENLEFVHSRIPNVDWTAVAGFGIGVTNLIAGHLNRREYIKTFYHPKTNEPFYHPNCWDESFRKLHTSHIEKYQSKFGDRFPTFGIEDRYRWKFALCGLRNCKKHADGWFYDGYKVYKEGTMPENRVLEKYVSDMIEKFFFGDPSYYYVKLFE